MLLSMSPKQARVVYLVNPGNPQAVLSFKTVQDAGKKRGVTILLAEARTPQEIDKAFASFRQQNVGALVVLLDGLFQQQRSKIVELAMKHRLPSISADSMYAEAGGLINYGTNLAEQFRYAATIVDKILKGAKPADLPVEQPTKFELIINGKTAKALGLKIPQSLLIMADKVIE
jgi:putative ABC transport system substrate-binding protein